MQDDVSMTVGRRWHLTEPRIDAEFVSDMNQLDLRYHQITSGAGEEQEEAKRRRVASYAMQLPAGERWNCSFFSLLQFVQKYYYCVFLSAILLTIVFSLAISWLR